MDRLNGKVALVTGAASGLGREVVDLFSSEGAAVVVFDRDAENAEGLANDLTQIGRRVRAFVGDVVNPADFDRAIDLCHTEFGGFDVIHNNAAIMVESPLHETTDAEYDRLVDVNIRGVFNGCRAAVRDFLAADTPGAIVNTTSIQAHSGAKHGAMYGATKAALLGLTYSISSGYAINGIRTNCVSPGDMETPMLQKFFETADNPVAARNEIVALYPGKRIAHPREVAQVVLFLASDEASFINGQCVVADGGLLTTMV